MAKHSKAVDQRAHSGGNGHLPLWGDVARHHAGDCSELDATVCAVVYSGVRVDVPVVRIFHAVRKHAAVPPSRDGPLALDRQSVLYRGADVEVVWRELLTMIGLSAAFVAVALFRFKAMLARQS
nr:hypothetical protein [Nordella sp. HKS 07]